MNEPIVSQDTALRGFNDYIRFFPLVWKIVWQSPFFYCLIAFTAVETFVSKGPIHDLFRLGLIPGIGIALNAIVMQSFIGKLVEPASTEKMKINPDSIRNFFIVTILYAIFSIGLSLFLIVPGVWWMVKSSLSTVFVLAEKSSAISSLKLSHKLTTGHFWTVVKYLLPAQLIGIAACCVAVVAMAIVDVLKIPNSVLEIILCILIQVLSLAIIPLLVQLYVVLKEKHSESSLNSSLS